MHKFSMPDWATARVTKRQGKPLAHTDVAPDKTALLVVDMQNYFLEPGAPGEVGNARGIVQNINRLADALRRNGGLVVWVRTLFTPEALEALPNFHNVLLTPEFKEIRSAALAEDAHLSQIWPELDVHESDLISRKTRYSAFIQGASDLEAELHKRQIEAVLIAGTTTNTCCETTARDAMMVNFRTTMVSDCNASPRDEEHASALINFYVQFGDVTTSDEFISRFPAA